jgi:hypothetical protein
MRWMTSTSGLVAVDEHNEEQNQLSGHPDDLITLLSSNLDEVVIAHHVIRIVEHLRRCLEGDPTDQLITFGFGKILCESHSHITLSYIHSPRAK